MNSPPETGDSNTTTGWSRFRVFNPALTTVLVTALLAAIASGGLTVLGLLSVVDGAPTVILAFGRGGLVLTVVVVSLLVAGWLVSGYAVRGGWLQVATCIVVFLVSAGFFVMLAFSVFLSGLKH